MKKLFSFLFLLFVSMGAHAFEVDGIAYKTKNDQVVYVTQKTGGYKGSITIPESVTYDNKTYKVALIDSRAFAGSSISEVTIPKTVYSIGIGAFDNCSLLVHVVIKSPYISDPAYNNYKLYTKDYNLTTIFGKQVVDYGFVDCENVGDSALYGANMKALYLEGPVKVGQGTFFKCDSLKNLVFDNDSIFCSKSYSKNYNMTNIFGKQVEELYIHNCALGKYALYGASNLKLVYVGVGVKSIGTGAFQNCGNLKDVRIRDRNISSRTYTATSNLKHIFGAQVETYSFIGYVLGRVGDYALYGAANVKKINVDFLGIDTIGKYAFAGTSVKAFSIDYATTFREGALSSVEELTIKSQLFCNTKPQTPFSDVVGSKLKKVIFGGDVTTIGDAFAGGTPKGTGSIDFSGLEEINGDICIFANYDTITLGDKTKTFSTMKVGVPSEDGIKPCPINTLVLNGNFEYENFSYFSPYTIFRHHSFGEVENVEFRNATSVGDYLFRRDSPNLTDRGTKLKSVKLCEGMETIGLSSFSGLPALEKVYFPEGLTKIGAFAFQNCSSLNAPINLPSSLEEIGVQAFDGCKKITSVAFPSSVTIKDGAFKDCGSLMNLKITGESLTFAENAFDGVGEKLELVIDYTDSLPMLPTDKECLVITKTEKRANEWRAEGFKTVISKQRMSADVEDTNMDGKTNAQDALKIYNAMMKQ